jgi:hypothetical protein
MNVFKKSIHTYIHINIHTYIHIRTQTTMHFGAPITVEENESAQDLSARVHTSLQRLIDEKQGRRHRSYVHALRKRFGNLSLSLNLSVVWKWLCYRHWLTKNKAGDTNRICMLQEKYLGTCGVKTAMLQESMYGRLWRKHLSVCHGASWCFEKEIWELESESESECGVERAVLQALICATLWRRYWSYVYHDAVGKRFVNLSLSLVWKWLCYTNWFTQNCVEVTDDRWIKVSWAWAWVWAWSWECERKYVHRDAS